MFQQPFKKSVENAVIPSPRNGWHLNVSHSAKCHDFIHFHVFLGESFYNHLDVLSYLQVLRVLTALVRKSISCLFT